MKLVRQLKPIDPKWFVGFIAQCRECNQSFEIESHDVVYETAFRKHDMLCLAALCDCPQCHHVMIACSAVPRNPVKTSDSWLGELLLKDSSEQAINH